jgi:hypothetical protein
MRSSGLNAPQRFSSRTAQEKLMPPLTSIVQHFEIYPRYFSFILKPKCRFSKPSRS